MNLLESLLGMSVFVMGCGCHVVGCVMVADSLRWRLQGQRVTGTLIGVRDDLGSSLSDLFAVYRYVDARGEEVEAVSQIGTDCPRDLPRGPRVPLLALRNPHRVREANRYAPDIVAPTFIAAGLAILYALLRSWSWPIQQIVAFGAVIAALSGAWALLRHSSRPDPERRPGVHRRGPLGGAVTVIIGFVLVAAGPTVGRYVLHPKQAGGLHASGTVIRTHQSRDSDGTRYFAVVRFNTASGATVEFQDNIGNSPAVYSVGKQVRVSYTQSNPSTATIDRGISSIFPLLFAVLGLGTMIWGTLSIKSAWGASSRGSASGSQR